MVKALLQGSVLALGGVLAAPIFAAHVIPTNTTFTASGPTSMTQLGVTIHCNSTFTLVSDGSGNVTVTQATFAAGNPLCPALSTSVLPWPVSFGSTTNAVINHVQVASALGACSGNVNASIENSHIRLSGALGLCAVSGDLTAVPAFTVVN